MSEEREGGIKWRRDQIGGDISCGAWEGTRKGEGTRWRIACVIYVLARGETLSDGREEGEREGTDIKISGWREERKVSIHIRPSQKIIL